MRQVSVAQDGLDPFTGQNHAQCLVLHPTVRAGMALGGPLGELGAKNFSPLHVWDRREPE